MSVVILRGDAASLPLPDASVDLIVTSPPYFGLRSYSDGGAHYDGQVGSEATPREFLEALLACTREWVRVLKPSGSIFVNLGDKYASSGGAQGQGAGGQMAGRAVTEARRRAVAVAAKPQASDGTSRPKSLMGLPWRYAIGCMDDLGLILRAEIVWAKPNGLPESVTDRVRRSHEQVFHFTRQPRYYSAVDEVREPHIAAATGRNTSGWKPGPSGNREIGRGEWSGTTVRDFATSPLGKLPGSVWEIPSQPLAVPAHLGVDHFAAFPMELPRRVILGWSPSGICTECGEGRRPVANHDRLDIRPGYSKTHNGQALGIPQSGGTKWKTKGQTDVTIAGYACACVQPDAPARPAVVLDPFGGTGTTALVAAVHGRTGISIDRSADYSRIAQWRTADPGERARALGVPKPPPVPEGQGSLFDDREVS